MNEAPIEQQLEQQLELFDTIPLNTAGQVVELVVGWHRRQVALIEQLRKIPLGAELLVGDQSIVLDETLHNTFLLGAEIVLNEFKDLPFTYQLASDVPADPAPLLEHATA